MRLSGIEPSLCRLISVLSNSSALRKSCIFNPLTDKKSLATALKNFFDPNHLNALARKTGFIKRITSKLKGSELIEVLSVDMLENPEMSYEAMCGRIEELNPDASLTPQSLEERINKEETIEYIKEVLEGAINKRLSFLMQESHSLFSLFSDVEIQDSTIITLNEKLADKFKGSGGNASSSSIKVDFIYSLKYCKVVKITLHEGNCPDQSIAKNDSYTAPIGSLHLQDLGYFLLERFKLLDMDGRYYLSRLLDTVNVYLSPEDSTCVDLPEYIDKEFKHTNIVDITVYIGAKERLPVRLVAYRLPEQVVAERRRKAIENARKKGRTLSKKHLNRLRFSCFITNVPKEILKPEVIGTVYRIRWQIELMFKYWKSLLNIHILKGTRAERIQCIIYSRLLSIVLITQICGYAAKCAWNTCKKELSIHKTISWLLSRFRDIPNNADNVLTRLENTLHRLCKQKRKRKTTLELIDTGTGYLEYTG